MDLKLGTQVSVLTIEIGGATSARGLRDHLALGEGHRGQRAGRKENGERLVTDSGGRSG